jgi:3-oxoacyl-[acyl-carrier protein] reductase
MKLKDKVAVVTGSSRGLGAATGRLFAEEGATVVINYPGQDEQANALEIVRTIEEAGGRASAIPADVSDWDAVEGMVAKVVENFGQIDILVNNAGVNSFKSMDDVTLTDWNRTIAVTLTGTFICSKCVLPHMVTQGSGNIINIASIAPWYAGPTVDYNAAKAGILAITRTIAKHYGRSGVRCNTIAPGFHRSEMGVSLLESGIKIEFLDNIPVGFTPEPISLAKVALFLASEDSHYVHGHTLISDGGVTLL